PIKQWFGQSVPLYSGNTSGFAGPQASQNRYSLLYYSGQAGVRLSNRGTDSDFAGPRNSQTSSMYSYSSGTPANSGMFAANDRNASPSELHHRQPQQHHRPG